MAEERRLVTVLFADVVGSTTLGEALDPEDVRAILARLFGIATDSVERHGGRVEKFIGDAIMAVFGSPIAHDDDPARALSAAIELRDRVRADPVLSTRVPLRLGVNGGEVIASREANAQVLVTGDPVNTAARLQQAAEQWGILVGDRTVRAVGDRFQFGPLVEVEAKGKAAPIAARQLMGVASTRPRRRSTPIVGREADLDQLELVARRTFEERRPFLVSVVAPAGVGKSRLLEEFLDRLDPGVHVAIAQCLPYGQRLTYWPMRAILLSIVGLDDDSTPEALRAAVASWLREAGEPEADRFAELLAATVGAAEMEGDRLAVFAAWRRLVELAGERATQVVVIEDLHWSSDSLLDLVEAMLQPRADVPLLMIALARPELLDRRPTWGGGRRNAVSISLEPLPSGEIAALVADLLDAPDQQIVDAVVARAEGNPFYAGEIVRSLSERLGPAPNAAAVPGAIAALPDTVHATVLARLDALPPAARRVVQLGAVLGRSFEPRAIPAVDASLDEAIVLQAIEDLLDRDLVRHTPPSAVTFRHILIREVAYHTLPRAERARIHGTAGRWLEAQADATGRADELAELVAFHFREAVSMSSVLAEPVSEELKTSAVIWLRRAAEAAAAGAATVEASRHLNAAIDLAEPAVQPHMYERLGQIWTGGDQGAEAFERAWELGLELGLGPEHELRTLGQAMTVRARWTGSIGRRLSDAESARRYDIIRRLLPGAETDAARLHGQLALGFRQGLNDFNDPEELERDAVWAARALETARRLGQPDLISAAYDASGAVEIGRDEMRRVVELAEERHAFEDRVSTGERADAWIVQAWGQFVLGELADAEVSAERARAGLVQGQASAFVLGATAWRVLALHALGRWDEALVEAARAERAWHESELKAPWYALSGFLAALTIARGRGDPIGAERWQGVVLAIQERSDVEIRTRRLMAYVHDDLPALVRDVVGDFRNFAGRQDYVHLGLGLLADRRHPVGIAVLDDLLEYAGARGLGLITAQALRLRGVVTDSRADLEAALAAFEAMGAIPSIARVRTELGIIGGDAALMDLGLDAMERLGDIEQAARVGTERRSASLSHP
ncbi:MAG TPA: adenylate/guanylate cyclase domain-containing protein [Candidatus Limnocylindria bacterium]|nr:adenylate/guanylate cyclase domain-containing protein [Candidatus Limnocylindria bacterium]